LIIGFIGYFNTPIATALHEYIYRYTYTPTRAFISLLATASNGGRPLPQLSTDPPRYTIQEILFAGRITPAADFATYIISALIL
jgi:hypothetical protein